MLTARAPRTVRIDGRDFPLRWDHRTGIAMTQLLERADLADGDRLREALLLYYPVIPGNVTAAMRAMMDFYRCGRPAPADAGQPGGKRVFDFETDAPLVYAAFLEQYGIDLEACESLHWWKFMAMLDAAGSETQLRRVMEIRSVNLGKLKGEQRRMYQQLQQLYALPLPEARRERADAVADALMHGGVIPKELLCK